MRAFTAVFAGALAACFAPHPQAGSPCAPNGTCPDGLACIAGACVTPGTGGGGSDGGPQQADAALGGGDSGDGGGGGSATCWAAWLAGTVQLAAPVPLGVDSDAEELDPSFGENDLQLTFGRDTGNAFHPFLSERATTSDDFTTATPITDLTSTANDTRVTSDAAGDLVVIASSRSGGDASGTSDLWGLNANVTSMLSEKLLGELETVGNEFDPELTPDGLTIYFSSSHDNSDTQQILTSTRQSVADAFPLPAVVTLASVGDGTGALADPTVSPDQRVMVFTQVGSVGKSLYYATRTAADQPWLVRGEVPTVNRSMTEGDGELSSDGCTLLFSAQLTDNHDLFSATVITH